MKTPIIDTSTIPTLHVLEVSKMPATGTKWARIRIKSMRDGSKVVIPYDYNHSSALSGALQWLHDNGHTIVGQADGIGCTYVVIEGSLKTK